MVEGDNLNSFGIKEINYYYSININFCYNILNSFHTESLSK